MTVTYQPGDRAHCTRCLRQIVLWSPGRDPFTIPGWLPADLLDMDPPAVRSDCPELAGEHCTPYWSWTR